MNIPTHTTCIKYHDCKLDTLNTALIVLTINRMAIVVVAYANTIIHITTHIIIRNLGVVVFSIDNATNLTPNMATRVTLTMIATNMTTLDMNGVILDMVTPTAANRIPRRRL